VVKAARAEALSRVSPPNAPGTPLAQLKFSPLVAATARRLCDAACKELDMPNTTLAACASESPVRPTVEQVRALAARIAHLCRWCNVPGMHFLPTRCQEWDGSNVCDEWTVLRDDVLDCVLRTLYAAEADFARWAVEDFGLWNDVSKRLRVYNTSHGNEEYKHTFVCAVMCDSPLARSFVRHRRSVGLDLEAEMSRGNIEDVGHSLGQWALRHAMFEHRDSALTRLLVDNSSDASINRVFEWRRPIDFAVQSFTLSEYWFDALSALLDRAHADGSGVALVNTPKFVVSDLAARLRARIKSLPTQTQLLNIVASRDSAQITRDAKKSREALALADRIDSLHAATLAYPLLIATRIRGCVMEHPIGNVVPIFDIIAKLACFHLNEEDRDRAYGYASAPAVPIPPPAASVAQVA
jgi:hypothetical protein